MDYISNSPSKTETLAKEFLAKNPGVNLIGLSGDLGSGKTVFVKGIAKVLGINRNITSPTFVIEKIYKSKTYQLVHIDAYRLSGANDLQATGFDEFVSDPKNIVVIEWPERIFSVLPEKMRIIKFDYVSENKRKISF